MARRDTSEGLCGRELAGLTAGVEFPLSWAVWRVTTRLSSAMQLSHHPSSRLAGALGAALREAHCRRDSALPRACSPDSPDCAAWPPCLYGELIRTQTRAAETEKPRDVPRPLIVDPLDGGRESYEAGEVFAFDFTLVGRAVSHAQAVEEAVRRAGESGIGDDCRNGAGRFHIESVRPLVGPRGAPVVSPTSSALIGAEEVEKRAAGLRGPRLRFDFVRPVRLVRRGTSSKMQPLRAREMEFLDVWLPLIKRLSELNLHFGDGKVDWPFAAWKTLAQQVRVASDDLCWIEQRRYSGTQNKEIPTSGLLGSFVVEGDFEPLLPFLVAGEWFHVGKNADLGNGRYLLSPL